jgi:hypothetical protein
VSIMPSARASASTLGLTSTDPSGATTSVSLRLAPYCSNRAATSSVFRGVEHTVRLRVADEEIAKLQHVGRLRRPDQHGAGRAGLDQPDAAQDQRAHDPLAEVGLGDDQRAQLLGWNQQRLGVDVGVVVDERRASRELADLGGELPGALAHDRRDVPQPVALAGGHAAGQHDETAGSALAGANEPLAAREATQGSRTFACARCRSRSASGTSAPGARAGSSRRRRGAGGRRWARPSRDHRKHGPNSRTSTVAHSAAGMRLAISTASSRVAQSTRK